MDEVTTRNIMALKAYAEETRKELRDVQTQIETLQNQVVTTDGVVRQLQAQIGYLQQKILGGGPTSG